MAQVVCLAGMKAGVKCTHKRNLGAGVVVCAIQATPIVCRDAANPAEAVAQYAKLLEVTSDELVAAIEKGG